MKARNTIGTVLATLGVTIWLAGIGLHWWRPEVYRWELAPSVIGGLLGFVGFYMMRPKETLVGAQAIVDAGVRVLAVVRTGNRATDPVVTVTKLEPPPVAPKPDVMPGEGGSG